MGITKFHKLLKLVPFNKIRMFQNMKELKIEECDSLVEVFESEGGMIAKKGYTSIHYEIEKMFLVNLPKLRDIWGPNVMRLISFSKLTTIEIARCANLKSVFSYSMSKCLIQLTELSIQDCEIIEQIVAMEDEIMDNKGGKVKTLFPKLLTLELIGLPKLDCVCSRDYGYDIPLYDAEEEDKEINDKHQVQISFPQLQKLTLQDLPSLKCFCPGAYNYDQMLSSYSMKDYTQVATFPNGHITISTPNLHEEEVQKLETFRCLEQCEYQHLLAYIMRIPSLKLERCDKLLSCVPCNMMHLFKHLIELEVQQCGCLEEIFESNDYKGMGLLWMKLRSLPKLKHIWRNPGSIFGFQELRRVTISECHDLKFVFHDVSTAQSLQKLERIEVHECNRMEEIIQNNDNNKTVPKGAKIIFPRVKTISLMKLPKLSCFCLGFFHFELLVYYDITIEKCLKVETFCYGTLYTPCPCDFSVEGISFNQEKDVNEVIQEMQGQ